MGWLILVGSIKLYVSFAKEPHKRDAILQKRTIILSSLLIVATPYLPVKRNTARSTCSTICIETNRKYNDTYSSTRKYIHKCIINMYIHLPESRNRARPTGSTIFFFVFLFRKTTRRQDYYIHSWEHTHIHTYTHTHIHTYTHTHICNQYICIHKYIS